MRLLALGDGLDEVDEGEVGLQGVVLEAREGGADVSLAELRGGGDLAGEEPASERTEGHEADAELLEGGQDRLFRLAPEEGVLALQGRDRLHRVSSADGVDTGLGQTEVSDLAGVDELLDGAGDLLDGDVRVDTVLVEQVDRVGAQATQRALDGGADVVGPAGDAGLVAVLVEGEAELGGDDDLVADRLEGLADELLVVERTVDLGGVEEGHSAVDRGAQERDHLLPWRSRPERLAHAHAAEAEGGDLQAGALPRVRVCIAVLLGCDGVSGGGV